MSLNLQSGQETKVHRGGALSRFLRSLFPGGKVETTVTASTDETRELIESIGNAKKEWECATLNFEYASDEQVVDYYTYKIKACEVRYAYLIRKAKEKGIKVETPDATVGHFE